MAYVVSQSWKAKRQHCGNIIQSHPTSYKPKKSKCASLNSSQTHGISSHAPQETTQQIGAPHGQHRTIAIPWFLGEAFHHLCGHEGLDGAHQAEEDALDDDFGDAIGGENAGEVVAHLRCSEALGAWREIVRPKIWKKTRKQNI